MKCIRCGAEWKSSNMHPPMKKCPVCGNDFDKNRGQRVFSSEGELIYVLRKEEGKTIVSEPKRVFAFLNDYFPMNEGFRNQYLALYDKGFADTVSQYFSGSLQNKDISDFVQSNSNDDAFVDAILFSLSVVESNGTDFNDPKYWMNVLNQLSSDEYKSTVLKHASELSDDSTISEKIIELELNSGDIKRAAEKLEELASKGNPDALYKIATMYLEGEYYEKNLKKAVSLYKLSADKGNVEAEYRLGVISEDCNEVELDDCISYLKRASDKDHIQAQCRLYSTLYKDDKSKIEAIGYLKKAAFQNYPPAMYEYAMHLLYGDEVEKDIESAIRFLQTSADGGDKDAISKLVYLYTTGYEVERDEEKANHYRKMIER
ncbi:tetratricopeptide repeat protein [Butyrivibrio sp. AE3004]|uniref:tetratricopeptide repeat protein n=1 Tax=Butyrivibrio sp. AE3004 TaxID=1506994 RepID=UPI0004949C50|nr:tetratricopeptide repeat protein [Butyrivibrio sp. AE3004]